MKHQSTLPKTNRSAGSVLGSAVALGLLSYIACSCSARAQAFTPGDIVVSGSTYAGTASTVTVGEHLPGGASGKKGNAVADGAYPGVFNNDTPDPSFGVTSPIFLDELTPTGSLVDTINLSTTAAAAVTTSFSSKSELALNLSTDGSALTFMGYIAPVNTLDVSNANTPGHVDPTNPVAGVYQRAIVQVNANGTVSYTPVNTYSGNNGRAAILSDGPGGTGLYYTVGNAGNGSGTEPTDIVDNTGVQIETPGGGPETTPVGVQQGTPGSKNGFQYGYSVTENGYAADKSGKDDNFRGETIFDNTLYVTKGSGGNGIDTVYQVGATGSLPTLADAATTSISVLPGFPTDLATSTTGPYPFGLWFANATTLYVDDEGSGTATFNSDGTIASMGEEGGLEKWSLVDGTWDLDYTLSAGLGLGEQYSVAGYTGPAPATDGLRNLAGVVNSNGTVTLYAITSTVSQNGDEGADPNELVSITDNLSDTTLSEASGESFTTIDGPENLTVLRGVSFAPSVPDTGSTAVLFGGAAGLLAVAGSMPRGRRFLGFAS